MNIKMKYKRWQDLHKDRTNTNSWRIVNPRNRQRYKDKHKYKKTETFAFLVHSWLFEAGILLLFQNNSFSKLNENKGLHFQENKGFCGNKKENVEIRKKRKRKTKWEKCKKQKSIWKLQIHELDVFHLPSHSDTHYRQLPQEIIYSI
jgi:hypothetical protein